MKALKSDSAGVVGVDVGLGEVLVGDALGRRREVVSQPSQLSLEISHAFGAPLHLGPFELLGQLGELQLDPDGVVFQTWIRHAPGVPLRHR